MASKNILLTSAGRRVSLLRSFQTELRALMPEGKVFAADLQPELSAACQSADAWFSVPRCTEPEYIDALIALSAAQKIGLIVPTIDTELQILADNRDRLASHGVTVVISTSEFVRVCRDKRLTNEFFRAHDIDIPRAIDKGKPTFPLFVKPYDGSSSVGSMLVQNSAMLRPEHISDSRYLFQEVLSRADYDEYTVDAYYNKDSRLVCVVPRLRIETRTGEVSKSRTVKNELVNLLHERLSHIPGARGCLTFQFFKAKSNARICGIEINARFGGGYPLSYQARANYSRWLIEEYLLDRTAKRFDDWRDNLLMLRYDEEVVIDESANPTERRSRL